MTRLEPHDPMAGLARQLASQPSLSAVLDRVVQAAVVQIDGADHAGITILSRKSVSTPAASDDVVRQIDREQYASGEGPCLTAATDHQAVVTVSDLHTDIRWPAFSKAVAEMPVRSVLSFQLYTDAETIGALNIYAGRPDAFTSDSIRNGSLLAAHAAVAAVSAAKNENLQIALKSRDMIGQAKGILMERHKITAEQAFELLITTSQHTHRKLHDIAYRLSITGELAAE